MDKNKKEILNLCSRYLDLDEEDHQYYEDKIVIMNHTDDSVGFHGQVAFMVFGYIQCKAIFENHARQGWELTDTIMEQEYTDWRDYSHLENEGVDMNS